MSIKKTRTISKNQSQNAAYIDTAKWQQSDDVIQITTQNGGVESTDELPCGVKEKIANQEKQIQNNNKPSIPSNSNVNLNQGENGILTRVARSSRIPRLIRNNTTLNKTPETLPLQRANSDLLQGKRAASSRVDNYLGANHQVQRCFLSEVRAKYPLNPSIVSNPKVDSHLIFKGKTQKKRDFVAENICAVLKSKK